MGPIETEANGGGRGTRSAAGGMSGEGSTRGHAGGEGAARGAGAGRPRGRRARFALRAGVPLFALALMALVSVAHAAHLGPGVANAAAAQQAGQQEGNGSVNGSDCFAEFYANQALCKALHCEATYFLWIRWGLDCLEPAYTQCNQAAKDVFECCKDGTC